MPGYGLFEVPQHGSPIEVLEHGVLRVPDKPIVGWIEGDGIGPDIWAALAATRDVSDP